MQESEKLTIPEESEEELVAFCKAMGDSKEQIAKFLSAYKERKERKEAKQNTSGNGISYYQDDAYHFYAYVGNLQVGEMVLEEDDGIGYVWLDNINVNEGYRRRGIGRNLIKLAVDQHEDAFQVPLRAGALGNHYKYYFAGQDGVLLIQDCITRGILTETIHCNVTPPVASEDEEDSNHSRSGYLGGFDIISDESEHDEEEDDLGAEAKSPKEPLNSHLQKSPSHSGSSVFHSASESEDSEQNEKREKQSGVDITDEEMAASAFGQGSNIAKSM